MILIGYNLYGFCDVACYVNTEPQTGRDTVGLMPGRGCRHPGKPANVAGQPQTLNHQQGGPCVNNDRRWGEVTRVAPAPVQGRATTGMVSPVGQSRGHFNSGRLVAV